MLNAMWQLTLIWACICLFAIGMGVLWFITIKTLKLIERMDRRNERRRKREKAKYQWYKDYYHY